MDDDSAVLELVRAVLRRAGFAVETAANGAQALRRMSADRYDVVVLDLMMPQLSGFDVLKALATGERRTRFVVVMSAASQGVVNRAVSENVFASLRKPFEIDDLVRTVQACSGC